MTTELDYALDYESADHEAAVYLESPGYIGNLSRCYEALRKENAKLRDFANWVFDETQDACDLDGGSLQDKALEMGLWREIPGGYDPEKHGEHDYCEKGDPMYERTEILRTPQPAIPDTSLGETR